MGAIASQIISLTIVYSTVYSDADQRKHQRSALPAFVQGPAQMASNAENASIWWRHHVFVLCELFTNIRNVVTLAQPRSSYECLCTDEVILTDIPTNRSSGKKN